jgi:hypothetical protein
VPAATLLLSRSGWNRHVDEDGSPFVVKMSNTVIPHGYVVPDTDPHELDGNVYYLPVLEFEDANDYPGPFSDQAGLVLKRIDSGTLYRVGSYEIWLIEGIEMFRASIRDHECQKTAE